MRTSQVGLLLVLISTIGSAAFLVTDAASDADAAPAPKKIVAPRSTPAESSDESHSQVPQQSPGEVIGIPMLA
jgi:hypothetical protein